jgi:primosomal protein N''
LTLPAIQSASDLVAAVGAVADAVGAEDITPDEGQVVASILEAKRRAIETVDLEARLSALEQERKWRWSL